MRWRCMVAMWFAISASAGCSGGRGEDVSAPTQTRDEAVAPEAPMEHPPPEPAPATDPASPVAAAKDGECDDTHPARCFQLARALPAGSDTRELVGFLEPACQGGLPQACYSLAAVLKVGGRGVPADPARAQELIQQACREGSQLACDALGH